MKRPVLAILIFYKKWISPVLVLTFGHSCRFEPTCSDYSYQAIQKFGVLRGLSLSIRRIIRCNPLTKPGPDPLIDAF